MKAVVYGLGDANDITQLLRPHHAIIEVTLNDNRQVQLVVEETGRIALRAWGNIAMLMGNSDQIHLDYILQKEEPTHDMSGSRL